MSTAVLKWIIRDYHMTFSILALVLARDSHIKPDSEAGGLIPGTIWKISCHNLLITYFTLTFSNHWLLYCKKIFELTNYENKFLKESCLCSTCKYFCFKFGFKNIPNNVDLYNDVRNCLQNLPKTLTFEWKFLFGTRYTFELIIPFQVKLYSNMLKCVNFIEIRSYAYLYAPSFLVLRQQSI
jgi:hypothetical protein